MNRKITIIGVALSAMFAVGACAGGETHGDTAMAPGVAGTTTGVMGTDTGLGATGVGATVGMTAGATTGARTP